LTPLIETMRDLDELKLGGNKFGTKGVALICNTIWVHDSVEELDLSGCDAGAGTGVAIADYLRHSNHLKVGGC